MKKIEDYKAWWRKPYNEKVLNCEDCPYNEQFDSWEGKLPCGHQMCWADAMREQLIRNGLDPDEDDMCCDDALELNFEV